jgi:hypothetical protein
MENQRHSGGWKFHKEGCSCYPCKARRREKEALTFPIGVGGTPVAVAEKIAAIINGDAPIVVKGNTPKDYILQWAAYKAKDPDMLDKDIAKALGISANWMKECKSRAVREGWLKFDNPLSRIEHELIPKVVDNLNEFLTKESGEDDTRRDLRAKVSLETAKHTVFPEFKEVKGIRESPTTILALKIEPASTDRPAIITGQIIGVAKELEE